MLRRLYIFSLVLLILVTYSCTEQEETPDRSGPTILVESPTPDQRVHGLLDVYVTIEDQSSKILNEIYLDGNLIKESDGKEIIVEIDTKALAEGKHAIVIKSSDESGNFSEKAVEFEVRNILFALQVSSNYVPEYTEIYFVLTANDGTLISAEKIENGGYISVPTPANFNPDSSFVIGEYFSLYQPPLFEGDFEYLIKSRNFWTGINAGEFMLAENADRMVPMGVHSLKVTDVPTENYRARIAGTNIGGRTGFFGADGSIDVDLSLRDNTSDFYFLLEKEGQAPQFKYLASIDIGGATQFSCADLEPMELVATNTNHASGNYHLEVETPTGFLVYYADGVLTDGAIPIHYPASLYPEYHFYMYYDDGTYTHANRTTATTPPASFEYLDAEVTGVTYSNQILEFSTTGTFDNVSISGGSINIDGGVFNSNSYSAIFHLDGTKRLTIPEPPALLSHLGFSSVNDFEFVTAGFADYKNISGASDYQNRLVFSADNVSRQSLDCVLKSRSINTSNSGGRLAPRQGVVVPQQLKDILQGRLGQ